MTRRMIDGRNHLVGSGQMNHPERLEALEDARARHERLTRGKPVRPFREIFDEKMKKVTRRNEDDREGEERGEREADEDLLEVGAIDPHLGLAVGQKPELANRPKNGGRRSAKVILRG